MNGLYNVHRKDRKSGSGGGVCVLTKKGIKCLEVNSVLLSSEIIAVDVFDAAFQKIRIICAYYSPTGLAAELAERMRVLCCDLEQLVANVSPVVIVGDFNQPRIDWNRYISGGPPQGKEDIFLSFCLLHGLSQLVGSATRPGSGTVLDLLLTDEEDIVNMISVDAAPTKSDHLAVYFKLVFNKPATATGRKLNYRKTNYEAVGGNWQP